MSGAKCIMYTWTVGDPSMQVRRAGLAVPALWYIAPLSISMGSQQPRDSRGDPRHREQQRVRGRRTRRVARERERERERASVGKEDCGGL